MKTKIYFLFIAAIAFTFSLKAQYINLANDGDVEEAADTAGAVAPNWTELGPAANVTFTVVSDTVHSGKRAMKAYVVNRDSIAGLADWSIQLVNEYTKVYENAGYKYSIWAMAKLSTMKVNFTIGTSSYSELGRIGGKALTTGWAQYSFMFNSLTNDSVRAPIHLLSNGAYFFDDFSIVQTPLQSVHISKDGDSIMLYAGWNVGTIDPTFDISTITANINGKPVDIVSVINNAKNKKIIQCKLDSKVQKGDSVLVSYNGTSIVFNDANGPDTFDVFSNVPVDMSTLNNSVIAENTNLSNVSIYPNPVENNLRVVGINKITSVIISNISGQQILKFSNVSDNSIDISSLKEGFYFVTLNNNAVLKFIKK